MFPNRALSNLHVGAHLRKLLVIFYCKLDMSWLYHVSIFFSINPSKIKDFHS